MLVLTPFPPARAPAWASRGARAGPIPPQPGAQEGPLRASVSTASPSARCVPGPAPAARVLEGWEPGKN